MGIVRRYSSSGRVEYLFSLITCVASKMLSLLNATKIGGQHTPWILTKKTVGNTKHAAGISPKGDMFSVGVISLPRVLSVGSRNLKHISKR